MYCWAALLASPDVEALHLCGHRRELIDRVDIIALVVRNVDPLCNKSRVAIYGSQHC